ncbi:MAG: hypothetical protein WBE26_12835 [Phycisphaerae bacterium]
MTPLGYTIEEARRNLALVDAEADADADGSSDPDSDASSVVAIHKVRDVGDAYCEWLHNHGRSALTIQDAVRAFDAYPKCGDVVIEQVNKAYFLLDRRHRGLSTIKHIYLYPLHRRFRQQLHATAEPQLARVY